MTLQKRKALYPGSFNPFTKGHADIVARAAGLFDEVIIAIGFNSEKGKPDDLDERLENIRSLYSGNSKVRVESYSGLTVEYARQTGAKVLIRGVRDVKDFEYERNLADANRAISGIDTLLLTARPEYGFISSSLVRELEHYGYDVTPFLPEIFPRG